MAKLNDIRALAESHATEISRSTPTWTGYLATAATLYRHDFSESLPIHAQRPDAPCLRGAGSLEMTILDIRKGSWAG